MMYEVVYNEIKSIIEDQEYTPSKLVGYARIEKLTGKSNAAKYLLSSGLINSNATWVHVLPTKSIGKIRKSEFLRPLDYFKTKLETQTIDINEILNSFINDIIKLMNRGNEQKLSAKKLKKVDTQTVPETFDEVNVRFDYISNGCLYQNDNDNTVKVNELYELSKTEKSRQLNENVKYCDFIRLIIDVDEFKYHKNITEFIDHLYNTLGESL